MGTMKDGLWIQLNPLEFCTYRRKRHSHPLGSPAATHPDRSGNWRRDFHVSSVRFSTTTLLSRVSLSREKWTHKFSGFFNGGTCSGIESHTRWVVRASTYWDLEVTWLIHQINPHTIPTNKEFLILLQFSSDLRSSWRLKPIGSVFTSCSFLFVFQVN